MLIDDVTIKVVAGKGGAGAVSFEKGRFAKGPTGGDGGDGGNVCLEGVSDLSALKQFRYKKEITGNPGKNAEGRLKNGKNGDDIFVKVPLGTVIYNLTNGKKEEITEIGQIVTIAYGGKGGRGNNSFKSSRNTTPLQSQSGLPGETFKIRLELKLIADIGLVGLPNAGKSTLLNEITNASSRVANYDFTTLEAHLGTYNGLILADIPGLIEGASLGKGLGIKFLRHIERTKILFHLIAADSKNPKKDYEVIRKELAIHNPEILKKKEYIFISKADLAEKKELDKKIKLFKKAYPLSIIDEKSMKNIKKILDKINEEKTRNNESD